MTKDSGSPWPQPQSWQIQPVIKQNKMNWISFALGVAVGIIAGFVILLIVLLGFAKGMSG